MKLTAILLIISALHVSAGGYGQRVTLRLNKAPLESVFREIRKQTGFGFIYAREQLANTKAVDLDVKNEQLETVLKLLFKNQPLDYTVQGKFISLKQKLPAALPVQAGAAIAIDVKGVVRDESGKPAAGVSVRVKGVNKGTYTNDNGEFALNGVDDNAILIFSSVNLQTIEMRVQAGNSNNIAVTLKAKISNLEEIVVNTPVNTGIQEIPRERATGSFGFINNQIIDRTISTDIISRINGTTPGLLISPKTDPRNAASIRSASTIVANNQPLIVLDNFPFDGDLNSINPNDIENITVLKDASAASIWGVLAGNGVIVITTKKGKYNQKVKLSFNSNVRMVDRPDLFSGNQLIAPSDYADVEIFLFNRGYYNNNITSIQRPRLTPVVETLLNRRNGSISAGDSASRINELKQYDVRNDLSNYYYRKSFNQQYALNISGGSANQQYYASVGFDKNLNGTIGSDYQRITINANNTYSLFKNKLEISTSLWFAQTNSSQAGSIGSTYPYARLADNNGNPLPIARYRKEYTDTAGSGRLLDWGYYPLDDILHTANKVKAISYRFNTEIKYKFLPSLNGSLRYSYESGVSESRNLDGIETFDTRDLINSFTSINFSTGVVTRRIPVGGVLDINNDRYYSQGIRGQFNYSQNWNGKHSLNVLAAAELREVNTTGYSFRSFGYNSDNLNSVPVDFVNNYPTYITGAMQPIPNNTGIYGRTQRVVSLFSNAAYTYKERYTLSASIRRDGSNQFGVSANNKWKPLWSTGIAWDITKESFYNIKWLPLLRLRATYGYQGNIDYTTAAVLTARQIGNNFYNVPYYNITNSPNPDLRWEQIGIVNFGVDFGLFNKRLSGSIEYYQKKGVDLIGVSPLPPSAGIITFKGNTANIKGNGIDIGLSYNDNLGKIAWQSVVNFSYALDKITDYKNVRSNIRDYIVSNGPASPSFSPIVGDPVSAIYSYRWAGLDPATGDPQGIFSKQISKAYTSLISSTDLSDMVYNGPAIPPYFGNLLNSFSCKKFSISFNIIYKLGFYFRRSSIDYGSLFTGGENSNDYNFRWQKPGDEQFTNVPSLVYPVNANRDLFYNKSEALIEKGDYLRLQDIRLSYSIVPSKKTGQSVIQRMQLYAYATNLGYLWTANRKKLDPENPGSSQRIGKSFAAGVKLDF